MTKKIDQETRSWPENGEAEAALSSLRGGLERIRSKVELARQALQPARDETPGETDPSDRV
ncbi:hypothetical protein [Phenylobacterium deserti]|uniref:Uncharacterized protein n=1 Tax=Phenylobacterium deserti TaxID=1914756 RepID=A0A328ATU7_9CAUL|nr:hypothetical protein [Phenylobacterium deserti]RAK57695.1 hypothetical protein DJ018_07165 [Phenylobacterium deserti]